MRKTTIDPVQVRKIFSRYSKADVLLMIGILLKLLVR